MNILKNIFLAFLIICLGSCEKIPTTKTKEIKKIGSGYRFDKDGWIYVHVEGTPFERGKQFAYLVAEEYKKAVDTWTLMTYETTGMDYSFFVEKGATMHKSKIPPELLDEIKGMVEGLKQAGINASVDDIIGWNSCLELTSNWWPQVQDKYKALAPMGKSPSRCSAFIATGKATKDGEIVIGHSTFDDFWNAPYDNIILDILPTEGNRIIMQTQPLYLSSMEDFYITSAGIVAVETTLSDFNGYDENKTPEYVRARMSMQHGKDIDSVISILNDGNNGGVAATWLIGDIKTNEIARFEQGLLYQKIDKKTDGYFSGYNAATDPRVRNLECSANQGYNDIRRHTGARRVRWEKLLTKKYGKLDAETGKQMLGDHYDVYSKKINPSAKSICGHYDNDPRNFMSSQDASHPDPYSPAGSIDGKVTTSSLAKKMTMWARFRRGCGTAFDAEKYIKNHPQWAWQKKVLKNRPSKPWCQFSAKAKP